MADLIAEGNHPHHRWRRTLPTDRSITIGRGTAAVWATPWDDRISRQHVEVVWNGDTLTVRRLPTARNPLFFRGCEVDTTELSPGEHFVLGQTTFTLSADRAEVSLAATHPAEEQTFTAQYLQGIRFRNAEQRLEVLSRMPEVISGAGSDAELFARLTNVLLAGIRRASAVAIVESDPRQASVGSRVLHWDRRLAIGGDFQPSQRLISEALKRRSTVLHVWNAPLTEATTESVSMTANDAYDWAFATPIGAREPPTWCLYVAGSFRGELPGSGTPTDPGDLREELKFAELVAAFVSSIREVRALQKQQAGLTQFFSPKVLEVLAREDPEVVFRPRETEVTVLFCDLRGFSAESERYADQLLPLLERVSDALGVMTHHILAGDGVVGDFHGDAAMGFWGWPLPQPDKVQRACRAALAIREQFEAARRADDHRLANFRMGIGIATGRAVAGKIGTVDQVKVTVFGPVVNLASRLEGMTKLLRTPILLDPTTAQRARQQMSSNEARFRRLATVRPAGMDTPVEVAELLPPRDRYPLLSDEHLAWFEEAVEAFQNGDWARANELLHRVPANDRAKDFLTIYIAQHDRNPPTGWSGVVPLDRK